MRVFGGHRHPAGVAVLAGILLASCTTVSSGSAASLAASTPGVAVIAGVDLPELPGAAASGPDGLWIANYDTGRLAQVSGEHPLRIATIQVGDPRSLQPDCQAGSVHYAPTGSFIIRRCDLPAGAAVGAGSVWTGRNDLEAVVRVDPISRKVIATIPVGMHIFNLAASDSAVWVTSYEDNLVAAIDPKTNRVRFRETLLHSPSGIAFADGSVWIALTGGFAVVRLDPRTGDVLATVPVGKKPFPMLSAAGAIWVRCEQDSTLWRIDPASNQAVASIGVDPFYGNDGLDSMVGAPGSVWISGLSLQRIDTSTNQIAGSLRVPGRPYAAAAGRMWVIGVGGRVSLVPLPG